MNIRTLKFLTLGLIASLFVACDDKKDDVATNKVYTVEENKENIQKSGIELVGELDAFKDSEGLKAAYSFSSFADMADPMEGNEKIKKSFTVEPILKSAVYQSNNSTVKNMFPSLKSAMAGAEEDEDFTSFTDLWNDMVGTYAWNGNDAWTFTAGGNEVILKFPSTETGTTNDATMRMYGFEVYNGNHPLKGEEYDGDILSKLNAELTVGTAATMTYSYQATFAADGVPSMLKSSVSFGSYVFATELSNTNTLGSITYSWTNGSKTLAKFNTTVKGDWTEPNVRVQDELDQPQELFTSAEASLQIMDFEMLGDVKIKDLVNKEDRIYEDEDSWMWGYDENFDYQAANAAEVEAINSNVNLKLQYTGGSTIAEFEAYSTESPDSYWKWVEDANDPWGGQYTEIEITSYDVDFRFIFPDKSKVDMETYFENDFADFVKEMNKLIVELNKDYDMEMDYIEY